MPSNSVSRVGLGGAVLSALQMEGGPSGIVGSLSNSVSTSLSSPSFVGLHSKTATQPAWELVLHSLRDMGLGVASFVFPEWWISYGIVFVASCAFFLLAYYLVNTYWPIPADATRKRAWVMTFFSAVISGPASLYVVMQLYTDSMNLGRFHQEYVFASSYLSEVLIVFFLAYMVLDIAVGMKDYRDQFDLMNWLHHIGYGILLLNALKWNFGNAFAIFLPSEFPTIFLAAGHVHPPYRQDMLFGSLFFFIRVCYHAVLSYYITFSDKPNSAWPVMWIVLALHIHWWIKWLIGQVRRSGLELALQVHLDELAELDLDIRRRLQEASERISHNFKALKATVTGEQPVGPPCEAEACGLPKSLTAAQMSALDMKSPTGRPRSSIKLPMPVPEEGDENEADMPELVIVRDTHHHHNKRDDGLTPLGLRVMAASMESAVLLGKSVDERGFGSVRVTLRPNEEDDEDNGERQPLISSPVPSNQKTGSMLPFDDDTSTDAFTQQHQPQN